MKYPFILVFLFLSFQLWGQEIHSNLYSETDKSPYSIDALQDSIVNQLALFPQEKIHLHTDRTMYIPGEKIWFKVYVVDALTHQSPTHSQYAYVELINSSDSLVQRVMVSYDDNGLFHGQIFLSDFISEGDYTLRAYTRYVENLGNDYFFKKHIRIGSLRDATPQTRRQGRQPRADYDVSFFPEGGNLLEATNSRVAFKALNERGGSESITGKIVDREGNKIVDVNTVFAGMGSFSFVPERGAAYFLVSRSSTGQEKRFKLPTAQTTYSLRTHSRHNAQFVQVRKSPDMPEQPLYLLVHCRGNILYFSSWDHHREYIPFRNNWLPSGVIHVLLLDEQMNPVSERLLFHKNNDQAQVAFSTDKSFYQKRELVTSEIYVTDTEGEPFAGHLSIAITDDMDIAPDTTHTILSSLLLSSELRGFIESPGYYLQDSREAVFALDHLMMTHGWRRYDLPEALKGNYQHPDIRYEEAKTLTGVVRGGIFSRRIANGVVTYIANDGSFDQTITDADGSFRFDLHYPDSTWFFVQAFNQRGGDGVELVLDNETFPRLQHAAVSSPFSFFGMDKPITDSDFMKKAGQRAQFDENIRMILLDEVIVTARRIDKRDEARLQYWGNLRSDVTIYREDFERRFVTDVTDILRNIPGVRVFIDGGISLRASDTSSFQGDGRPLVLIDGVPIPWEAGRSPLDLAPIFDIETIDILKGASAAIFGIRGANGAISITTRRGGDTFSEPIRPNQVTVTPIGFQQPAEFYSPKYDTPELRNSVMPDFRTTIFWKPDLIASDDGKVTFEFYTSDFSTTYSVVIEGLSDDGRIIRQIETIEVQ